MGGCYRPQYHLYCLGKNHTVAALKHYRGALMRINTSAAPEIDWPELPQ
ncbi:tail fiber assembly protein [Yersinia intermedia]